MNKSKIKQKNTEILKGIEVIEVAEIPSKFGKIEIKGGFFTTTIKIINEGIELSKLEDFVKLYNQFKKDPIYYYHFVYNDYDESYVEADIYMTELIDGRLIMYSVMLEVI